MDTAQRTSPLGNGWAGSADEWASRKRHDVVLPSGMRATIEIPELGLLVLANAVPTDLVELAREEVTNALGVTGAYGKRIAELDDSSDEHPDGTPESRAKIAELTATFARLLKWLVAEHVLVSPKVTVEQLSEGTFPLSDLDWLYGVAMRRVSEDALGRRLGVAPLDAFATFRHEHGLDPCPAGCEGCARTRQALSTVDLDRV